MRNLSADAACCAIGLWSHPLPSHWLLACANLGGGLFVELAADHMAKNLVFSRRKRGQAAAKLGQLLAGLARDAIPGQRLLNCLHQDVPLHWLGKNIARALLHGTDAG